MQYIAPIGIGILYAQLMSLVREPHRRRLNAVMVAGAGAAYLSGGGMGGWEFPFTALLTYVTSAVWSRGRGSASAGCCTRRGTSSTTSRATRSSRSPTPLPWAARSAPR
jgi:hypothetical protein